MAAIRKSCFLTDIIKIKISEKKKLFRFVKPHSFYILFAAYSVLFTEFLRKAGIAQTALLRNIGHTEIFGQKKVDILGDIFYYIIFCLRYKPAVNDHSLR